MIMIGGKLIEEGLSTKILNPFCTYVKLTILCKYDIKIATQISFINDVIFLTTKGGYSNV